MVVRERFSYKAIRDVLSGLLEQDLHAKRVSSLCDATLGVLHSGSLAICTIGQGLAAARSLKPKHAIKQVDRLLSNPAINVDDILVRWVPFVIGARDTIVVAMDWTDFDADKQATIMLALITDHGRSTPLVWLTVDKSTLKDHRTLYEHRVLVRLAELLPAGIKVCIVADRGFGDQKLYKMLTEELYFDYVIRFRGNIAVTAAGGETRSAAAWVQAGGRARVLRGATVTAALPSGSVVHTIAALGLAGTPGTVDVVVNTGTGLVEQALLPGLSVRVFKKTKKVGKKTIVTWWAQALDDGFGVPGAAFSAAAHQAHGNASGTANLSAAGFKKGRAKAAASGYVGASFQVP